MKIQGIEPDTGNVFQADADRVDDSFVTSMLNFELSEDEINKIIGNLNISADAKSLLYAFSKVTIKAGSFIIKIGRKIIDFIGLLYKEYPTTTFMVIFGAIAGFLISTIPILGAVLGSLFTPIAIALGMIAGIKEDFKDKELERKIAEINAKFTPLNA